MGEDGCGRTESEIHGAGRGRWQRRKKCAWRSCGGSGWGAKKLAVLLREQNTALTVTIINRILKRHGLIAHTDSHAPGLERFESSRASARIYQAEPPEWDYPKGSEVRRLNTWGCLEWEGRRWFLCEALAGRWVGVESMGRLLLVRYRRTYVREIDRLQGVTRLSSAAQFWWGSPVALRAPCEPHQKRKPGVRDVTDVLTHGITRVLTPHSSATPLRESME
jgi:hypothetical protein